MNFDQAFEKLIGHEGGYVAHQSDPGGATRYGVTERVARVEGYTGPMQTLPLEFAKGVYERNYWHALRCEDLPPQVRFQVFDAAVNSGTNQAAKWLQRAVGVSDDGRIGPQTLAACNNLPGYVIASRFNGQRLKFMTDLPTWADFGKGWARRIAANLMEA